MIDALVLDASDNVATALRDLRAGTRVVPTGPVEVFPSVDLLEAIPANHKFALSSLAAGQIVRKYGEAIGVARAAIEAGQHVHVHNIDSRRARRAGA